MASTKKTTTTTAASPPARKSTVSVSKAPGKAAAPVTSAKTITVAAKPKPKQKQKPTSSSAEGTKKIKLVRDSFTIPKTEYAVLEVLKQRAVNAGKQVKKSEVIRAGIKALAGMSDAAFAAAVSEVPAIKTGRPRKA